MLSTLHDVGCSSSAHALVVSASWAGGTSLSQPPSVPEHDPSPGSWAQWVPTHTHYRPVGLCLLSSSPSLSHPAQQKTKPSISPLKQPFSLSLLHLYYPCLIQLTASGLDPFQQPHHTCPPQSFLVCDQQVIHLNCRCDCILPYSSLFDVSHQPYHIAKWR